MKDWQPNQKMENGQQKWTNTSPYRKYIWKDAQTFSQWNKCRLKLHQSIIFHPSDWQHPNIYNTLIGEDCKERKLIHFWWENVIGATATEDN